MNWFEWLIFFLIVQLIHGIETWKMYKAAGFSPVAAFIPVYNAVVMMKIINRPWYWTFLLFLPVVNIIVFIVVWVEMCRAFGYNRTVDTVLVVATLGLYLYYLNYTQPLVHIKERSLDPRTKAGEWTSSILFAVVAATVVHTYFIQPFIIPTPSLEKTLLVGDFLLVSKFHYGARLPMTTVALPMVHDSIPGTKLKSYLSKPQLPYTRIPGFQDVQRNDIVVFNWPADSVDVYGADDGKFHYKPIDKKTNYVKRCVGIPGDTLSMVNGKVHINGEPLELPERARLQHSYELETDGYQFKDEDLVLNYDITSGYSQGRRKDNNKNVLILPAATTETIEKLKATGVIKNVTKKDELANSQFVTRIKDPKDENTVFYQPHVFPYTGLFNNTNDDRDPFLIPARGQTVDIDYKNIHYFKRIIEVYEGSQMGVINQVNIVGNNVLLNNAPLFEYTFKQNYYWLMGDNRDNSLDSRFWGYVPENHVVGKPVLVWMSYDTNKSFPTGVRVERLFTTVNGTGKPVSYFFYVLIIGGLLYGTIKFVKARKRKANKTL
ncbi:MAG: signal peptidase I [Nonlabens sp.]